MKIENPLVAKSRGMTLKGETANFISLQKRYAKGFLAAYYRFNDQLSLIPDEVKGAGTAGSNSKNS